MILSPLDWLLVAMATVLTLIVMQRVSDDGDDE